MHSESSPANSNRGTNLRRSASIILASHQRVNKTEINCDHVNKRGTHNMAVLNWTDAEVFQLLSCWAEEGVQEQLEGCKRNKHVYENLSKSLAEYNIEKTGEQCRNKVKKLHQDYKKIKDKHKLTGCGRIEWKFLKKNLMKY